MRSPRFTTLSGTEGPRPGRASLLALAALALAVVGLAAVPAGAAAQSGPTIAAPTPAQGALKIGDAVRVRALHARARFRALVDNRGVTGRFENPRGGVRRATLRRGRHLEAGANRLVISRGRGANRRHAARQFVLAKDSPLGDLAVSRVGGGRSLRVLVRGPAERYESLRIRLNGEPVDTRGAIVGTLAQDGEWPLGRRQFRASFGARDGLNYGRNRLRVVAWRSDGSFDRVTHTFRVRRGPLAHAEGGRRVDTGERVVLDGRRSRAPRGAKVRHRWKLVDAPEGSQAPLRRRGSARPRIATDLPGTYRIRLATRSPETGGRAIDETTIEATPPTPPIGVPIQTLTDDGAIELDGKAHSAEDGAWAQLLIVDRRTLEVKGNHSFGSSSGLTKQDVEMLTGAIGQAGESNLVVVSGGDRAVENDWVREEGTLEALESALERTGGMVEGLFDWQGNFVEMISEGHWSLIGVPGIDDSAHQNLFGMLYGQAAGDPSKPGALTGYLQEGDGSTYAFASGNYTTVDTSAPGAPEDANVIEVGSQHWTSGPVDSGAGGFHMVVLNSRLQLVYEGTFTTTQGFDEQSDLKEMRRRLNQYLIDPGDEAEPGYLVIVQSMGEPKPEVPTGSQPADSWVHDAPLAGDDYGQNESVPRNPSNWGPADGDGLTPLASLMGVLGGPAAHDQIANLNAPDVEETEGFALIASTGQLYEDPDSKVITPADPASTPFSRVHSPDHDAATQLPPRVVGELSRDRQSLWQIDTRGLTGGGEDASVAAVAYREPSEWPASDTDGEKAANAYLTHRLNYTSDDLRIEYYEDSDQDWNTILSRLGDFAYPGDGHGFTESEFGKVKTQLLIEVEAVSEVWALVDAWSSVFASAEINGFIDLQTIAAKIEKEVEKLDSSSDTKGRVEAIIGDSLWVADELLAMSGQEELAVPVGGLAAGFSLAASITTSSSGGPSLAPVEAEAGELGAQIAQRYGTIESQLDELGAILVSDWGKLQQTADNSENAWEWGSTTRGDVKETLTASSQRELWGALLSTVYGVYAVDPGWVFNRATNPWQISCLTHSGENSPFGSEDEDHNPSSWVRRVVRSHAVGDDPQMQWFGLNTQASFNTDQGWMDHSPDVVPEGFTKPLFARLGSTVSVDGRAKAGLGADPLAFMADSRFARWWFDCN